MSEGTAENMVILGSGPAGYTAALYAARADLQPVVVEGFLWGGLLQQTTDVENYPGFPDGIMGPELMQKFRDQAERFGTRFVTEDATAVSLSPDGGLHTVTVGEHVYQTRTLVLAMGAEPRKLGVPGEDDLAARGVSYCATCDAAFFRDKPTIVVGGGDTAMEDAIFLSKFAKSVMIVHRRSEFRASQIMLERAKNTDNIELLTPYVVERFLPNSVGSLAEAQLRNVDDQTTRKLDIDGAFIAIGHRPNSDLVGSQIDVDSEGYVLADEKSTRTNVAGVFASGDLVDRVYRQAVTAAGTGCQAALDAEAYLLEWPTTAEGHWVSNRQTQPAPN